jgi:hypothetical protein
VELKKYISLLIGLIILGDSWVSGSEQLTGRKGRNFSAEEDATIIAFLEQHGTHQWSQLALLFPQRSLKSVKDRWYGYLAPTKSSEHLPAYIHSTIASLVEHQIAFKNIDILLTRKFPQWAGLPKHSKTRIHHKITTFLGQYSHAAFVKMMAGVRPDLGDIDQPSLAPHPASVPETSAADYYRLSADMSVNPDYPIMSTEAPDDFRPNLKPYWTPEDERYRRPPEWSITGLGALHWSEVFSSMLETEPTPTPFPGFLGS